MKYTNKLLQDTFTNVAEMYGLSTDFEEDHFKLDYNKHYGYEIVKVDGDTGGESYPIFYPTGERKSGKEMYNYLQAMIKIKMSQERFELVDSITVIGRHYLDKKNGNPYHTSAIYVNGEHVKTTNYGFGGGRMYLQTAKNVLKDKGIIPKDYSSPLWIYCRDHNITLNRESVEGLTKKEMMQK